MKIVVIGMGYVGLANAVLLAQHHEVYAVDINQNKIDLQTKAEPQKIGSAQSN